MQKTPTMPDRTFSPFGFVVIANLIGHDKQHQLLAFLQAPRQVVGRRFERMAGLWKIAARV